MNNSVLTYYHAVEGYYNINTKTNSFTDVATSCVFNGYNVYTRPSINRCSFSDNDDGVCTYSVRLDFRWQTTRISSVL